MHDVVTLDIECAHLVAQRTGTAHDGVAETPTQVVQREVELLEHVTPLGIAEQIELLGCRRRNQTVGPHAQRPQPPAPVERLVDLQQTESGPRDLAAEVGGAVQLAWRT